MKQFRLLLTLLTLLAVGSMNIYAETIASWKNQSLSKNTAVKADGGNDANKGVASISSSVALTQKGTNAYFASSGGGAKITINNLDLSGYSDISMTFYSRGSKQGKITTTAGTGNVTVTKSEKQYTISSIPETTTSLTLTYGATSGSFYFGTVVISGTKTATCTTPTFTIEDKTISLSEAETGDYDMSANLTINKGGSTGAITYSCDNSDVDVTGGKFNTFNAGTYTINATMAADATYCEAPTSFTITIVPCTTSLAKPTGLNTSNITATTADLSWTAVPNATEYKITYGDAENPGTKQATATGTTYTLTNLTPQTGYIWAVKAIGDGATYCDSEDSQSGDFTTAAPPQYTITWSVNGTTTTTQVTEGDAIGTLPADPSAPSGCSDKVFVGWTITNIGATPTNDKPEFITANTIPTGNTTYYAVFATKSGSGAGGWKLVTSEKDLVAGEIYAIGSSSTANNGKVLGGQNENNRAAVDWSSTALAKLTLGGAKDMWTLYDGTGYLYAASSLKNYLRVQTINNDNGKWSITFSNNAATIEAQGDNTRNLLRYNSSNTIFSCYSSGQSPVYLFHYSAGISYTDYITECVNCTAPAEALALTLSQETANLGQDGNAVVTFSTTGGNGTEVTYAVTPTTGATLSGTTITFTQEGTYTLTASQSYTTANGITYCGGTDSKTITIAPAEYTLTLNDRGSKSTAGNCYAGAKVPQPADPTGVCTAPINYVFDGWATAEVAEGSTTYTKVSFPYTMPKANTTLYAVYKYSPIISNDYQKITAKADITDGEYLIVGYNSSTYKALSSVEGSTNGQYKAVAVTQTSNVITTDDETLIWNISVENGKYTIAQGGQYLNINNSVMVLESTAIPYTLAVSSEVFTFTTTDSESSSTTKISYYANNSIFNAYRNANTIYLYKRQQDIYYTTSPVCGPYVRITSGKELYVTAGNAGGTRSTVQVQDTVKFEAGNLQGSNGKEPKVKIPAADITCNGAATDKVKAVISQEATLNADGTYSIKGTVILTYKPTDFNVREDITLQLRAEYNTDDNVTLDAVTLHARSLPKKFVIVANSTDWYALNADMSGSSAQPANSHVTVDETADAAKAPCNTLYTFDGMPQGGDLRYVRFVGVSGKYLWAASADNVGVQNYAGNTPAADNDSYNWLLTTSDNITYTLSNPQNNRTLRLNDAKFAMYVSGVQEFRILPVTDTCVFNYAPANFRKEAVKSTSATLAWDAVSGATMYQFSTDGTTWTDVAATSYTLTLLTANTSYTCYLRARHGDGTDICSDVTSITFTTSDCDDVPSDLAYVSQLTSVILSWKATAATATVRVYTDAECTVQFGTEHIGVSSPFTIDGLEKASTYYVKVFAGGTCVSEVLEVHTDAPQMDVVEWAPDHMDVSINTDEKISVLLENQVTKGTGTGIIADELFFSKYFEATTGVKLVAVYNGTGKEVDITNYKIKYGKTNWESVNNSDRYIPLGEFSETQKVMAPGEEIILYTRTTADDEIMSCLEDNYPDAPWKEVTLKNNSGSGALSFAGDKTIALFKGDEAIDVIGGIDDSGNPISTGTSMYKPSWGDDPGWTCETGTSIKDGSVIGISTNRCLLVRKNTVRSGADAIAKNKSDFVTLCDEWTGEHVPDNDEDNGRQATCENFGYVGDFDYSGYYTTYEELSSTTFEASARNADGTITVSVPRMDTLACRGLKIVVSDKDGKTITQREYKVPILVNKNANTDDAYLFRFTADTCKTCDVVVRDNAKLTHTNGGVSEFRNMYIYAGSKLEIPQGETFALNSVQMFAKNDTVSYAIINNVNETAAPAITIGEVSHVKRIDGRYWYPFSLPYDCNIADIGQLNGQPLGVYGMDWGIKYYDGQRRQSDGNSETTYGEVSKYWTMMPEDGVLKAYTGYIIGLFVPAADEPLMKSVNFPPATESAYTESADSKQTTVTNWADNLSADKRHHGWNFVGSPYISLFGATEGEGLYNTGLKMGYTDRQGEQQDMEHIYVSIPDGGNKNTYTQSLAEGVTLRPFTAYFVQAIDPTNGQSNTLPLTYSKTQRLLLAPQRLLETEQDMLVELTLANGSATDNAGLWVGDDHTDDYEIGRDLTKMYSANSKPQLYTVAPYGRMAYQALPDAQAHAVPLGIYVPASGDYTLSLNRAVSRVNEAESVCLLYEGRVVADLLQAGYTLSAAGKGLVDGYTLDIRRSPKVVTDIVPVAGDAPYLIVRDGMLTIANLPAEAMVQVYDVLGRICFSAPAGAQTIDVVAPQTGVYTVVVTTGDQPYILKTLLH